MLYKLRGIPRSRWRARGGRNGRRLSSTVPSAPFVFFCFQQLVFAPILHSLSMTLVVGKSLSHQEKWWASYGLYFTLVPRRALTLQGFSVPCTEQETPVVELYQCPGRLSDDAAPTDWEAVEIVVQKQPQTLVIQLKQGMDLTAQQELTFYVFSPAKPCIPSYVPTYHEPFPGKQLNAMFDEGPAIRILTGRWGGETRFEIYRLDRRGFRGSVTFKPRVL